MIMNSYLTYRTVTLNDLEDYSVYSVIPWNMQHQFGTASLTFFVNDYDIIILFIFTELEDYYHRQFRAL